MHVPGQRELITIIGRFPDIHAGQTLRLTGFWKEHPKFGRQYQVISAHGTKPATLTGLEKYLDSGLVKGIGPATAKRTARTIKRRTWRSTDRYRDASLFRRGLLGPPTK